MTETIYSSKYEQGLSIVEIAKRVRKELKHEQQIAGPNIGLPPKAKFSVRVDKFSGGQSLNVEIDGVSGFLDPEHVYASHRDPYAWTPGRGWSTYGQGVLDRVTQIANAYNFDGSDIQSDYFHVNYYLHVQYSGRSREADKTRLLALLAEETAVAVANADQEIPVPARTEPGTLTGVSVPGFLPA